MGLRVQFANGPDDTGAIYEPGSTVESVNVISVVAESGPDDCGNPPPTATPPTLPEVTIPTDIDYEEDDGTPRSINVPIVFGFAYLNADVDIEVPVAIEVDADVFLRGTLNLTTGDVNFNFGGGGRPPGCNSPEIPDEEEIDPENPPEPDPLRPRIVAVRTDCELTSSANIPTQVFQPGVAPDLYIPRLCNIRFLCETEFGSATRWTNEIPVKSLQAITACPVPWGAVRVAVSPVSGVTVRAWQITRRLEDSEFPE